jgi:tetratricopeptide (TPR) repeat protein
MFRAKSIRPIIAFLSAGALAAGLALAPAAARAQSDQDRWQAAMDPADHAHMLGNLAEAEDHYLEALKLAERFDRTGGYLERAMAGLGGLYVSQERFAEAASLYRQALTIAEALYDTGHARHGVIAIYRTALAGAEAGNARQKAATRRVQEAAAARVKSPPPTRLTKPNAAPVPAPSPAPVPAPIPSAAAPVPVPPPPVPSVPVLSHYRLAGAVVPPPPPAEVLTPIPTPPPPAAAAKLPPAVAAVDVSVPEAALSMAVSPPEPAVSAARPAPDARSFVPLRGTPVSPAPSALPLAVEVADAAVPEAAMMAATPPPDVPRALAAVRPPEAEGLPLRGTPPPITRPKAVAPEDIAAISAPPASDARTVSPVEAGTAPAPVEGRSWDARPVEIAGQPVDAAAIRALAADPAAPPEVMRRAVAEETPAQIAQRKALEERHPVLGVRLGAAKRNMGPIYPDTPRLADTEQAYVAELEALERSLGPNHPDVAAMLYKLARLYQRQSRYEPAGRTYERCLALREKILPEGHPDIIETLVSYARLLRASGFSDLAAEMRKRAEAQKAPAN